MWLFLATEILLFGGLFVGFALQQAAHPQAFVEAHHHLDKIARRAEHGRAAVLELHDGDGGAFGGDEQAEGADRLPADHADLRGDLPCREVLRVHPQVPRGLLPGTFYSHKGDTVPNQFIFFSFYFMMTGLHGLHILGGMVAITWVLLKARKGDVRLHVLHAGRSGRLVLALGRS